MTLQTAAAPAGARPTVVATYTPTIGYRGQDSFSFAAVGPGGNSAPTTVAITVMGSPPTADRASRKVDGDGHDQLWSRRRRGTSARSS